MSYVGRAEKVKGKWIITAEPHVMIKLKNVFGGVAKNSVGKVELSDTPANCAELLWFTQRYPLEVIPRAYLVMQAALQHQREKTMTRIVSPDYVPPEAVGMALPPRHYQQVGAEFAFHAERSINGDDLGVGKTVTAITLLSRQICLPAVVVVQTQLCKQWARQLNRFLPSVAVHVAKQGTPYDVTISHYDRSRREWVHTREPDVLVINYHKLAGWAEWIIANNRAKTLVFDECQELRHHGTGKYVAAKAISESSRWCLGLSATPIINLGGEMWAVVDAIRPNALGTREEFGREWCTVAGSSEDGPKYAVKDPDALGMHLRASGIMLRRTRKDIGNELPPLQRVIHVVDTDNEAFADVARSAAELAKTILSTNNSGFMKMKASAELDWRLRQATGLAKAPHVAQFVRMIVEQGEPVILTGWHRAVYEMWLRFFTDEKLGNLKPVFVTGEESEKQKDDAVQKFRNGETNLLILSLRSGAGIDGLQDRCNVIVHGELDWSPKIMDQVDGRAHRDGQTKPVTSYYLVAEDGSDPVIMDVLGIKEAQSEGIRNPGKEVATPLGQVDPQHARRLAEAYLRKHGERFQDSPTTP